MNPDQDAAQQWRIRGLFSVRHGHWRVDVWPQTLIAGLLALLVASSAQAQTAGVPLIPNWFTSEANDTWSVAWGDVDGDGDLDLAVGNSGQPNQLFRNDDGTLTSTAVWSSVEIDNTRSVAWGDVDGDGDLDLAVGNAGDFDLAAGNSTHPNRLYRNDGGVLTSNAVWSSSEADDTTSVAWGDVDGDGDLDLAVGNAYAPSRLYRNDGGVLTTTAAWSSVEADSAKSIAWGDVDGDGDLDLAVGYFEQPVRLYRNDSGTLTAAAVWSSVEVGSINSVAWGDADGDGDLDLAVGNYGQNRLYRNDSGRLTTNAVWSSVEEDDTYSVSWGDVDGDGDLDLAVGNYGGGGQPNRLYRNDSGVLTTSAVWSSTETDATTSIAWGDVDGDGDLDLAVGNANPNRLYRNDGGVLIATAIWSSVEVEDTKSVAWGDVDGDGDLDLAVGNSMRPSRLYRNDSGVLTTNAVWSSAEADSTNSVAWGDVDGDGDLDLAVGGAVGPNRLYRNDSGMLTINAVWSSAETDSTNSVAWGDVDGDGDLDLAVGNYKTPNRLYRNDGGVLTNVAIWSSVEADWAQSIAWGDVDGDGDLDLAVGNFDAPNRLYRNEAGVLTTAAVWSSLKTDTTRSIAWGDVDGDGDLDLAAGNEGQPSRLFRNENGVLTAAAVWSSEESDNTLSIAWGDADGDGDLDLAVGNGGQPLRLYRNDGGVLTASAIGDPSEGNYAYSVAWGDVDGDGDLDLAVGNAGGQNRLYRNSRNTLAQRAATPFVNLRLPPGHGEAGFYSTAHVWSEPALPITYQLFQPRSIPAHRVLGYYSLDGSGHWLPAKPTTDTNTTELTSAPYPTVNDSNTHVFAWDIPNSGIMGQSDNMAFRLVVIPSLMPRRNAIPGPFLHGSYAATTLSFRLRGTQVQVVDAASGPRPLSEAQVYRLPSGQSRNALPYADRTGRPYLTNGQGFLQGRGELGVGDRLAALWPVPPANAITFTQNSTLYQTNAKPTLESLDLQPVIAPGVQVLTVRGDNRLLLFNLDVALEWDARKDAQFMETLRFSLARASDLLFDWTNGQAALGQVRIFQDAKHYPVDSTFNPWTDSHIRIYASNRIRPSASVGGIISPTLALSESVTIDGQTKVITYEPGQVRMGAVWNRYGETSGSLGDDWARALAHELGHYLFFQEDDYLGLDAQGMLVTVPAEGDPSTSCPSAMNDPYRESLSEFHPQTGWNDSGCTRTLSYQSTGRSDWQTIAQLYGLTQPSESFTAMNQGPNTQPLAVTQLEVISPTPAIATVDVPIFSLQRAGSGGTYLPGANAQAFLFQGDWLTDLGQPTLDQVQAWGARPGDRLCVFEPAAGYFGCEQVRSGDDQLAMEAKGAWQPEITVTPVNSYTIAVSVSAPLQGSSLCARLYPSDEPAKGAVQLQPIAAGADGTVLPATDEPTLEGYVHLWVPDEADGGCSEPQDSPRLEVVTGYAIGGNPIHRRARRTLTRAGGVHRRARRAPVISADGQVMVFGEALDLNQEQEWSFTLQATSSVPATPPGRTLVGQAYRLIASPNAPDLSGAAISFGYLGEQVPPGEENFLRIYFWQEDAAVCQPLGLSAPCWQPLDTFRDTEYNLASAKTKGPGLYALLASLEIPLTNVGWNSFAYSLLQRQPVASALDSLAGNYTVVYSYRPDQPGNEWRVFSPDAPAWANDLTQLEFGRGYLIYTTSPITLYLSSATTGVQAAATSAGLTPPAVIYGTLQPTADFAPTPGMEVTAWVGDKLCGRSQVQQQDGGPVYVIKVRADDDGAYDGCGADGRTVEIRVNGGELTAHAAWNNTIVQVALGSATPAHQIFLPDITAGNAEAE